MGTLPPRFLPTQMPRFLPRGTRTNPTPAHTMSPLRDQMLSLRGCRRRVAVQTGRSRLSSELGDERQG